MHFNTHTDLPTLEARLLALCEGLSAGCDPEFDAAHDDLEREFAERRLLLGRFE